MIQRFLSRSPVNGSPSTPAPSAPQLPSPSPAPSAPQPPSSSSDYALNTFPGPPDNDDDDSDDDNFYGVDGDRASNADNAASTIFDNGTIVETPQVVLPENEESSYYTQSEPGDMEMDQPTGTRISASRQVAEGSQSIDKCLAIKYQGEILEALHRSSHLKGLISSKLVSKERKRFDTKAPPGGEPPTDPEFSSELPGGSAAVKPLWDLFTRTLKHCIANQAYNLITGIYWTPRVHVDSVIGSIAQFDWFKALYLEVESGPLGKLGYFSPSNSASWNCQERVVPAMGFACWFLHQVSLALGEVQAAIIEYLHRHGRKNLTKYETSGKILDNWNQEGQYRSGRQATEILRKTGCISQGHGAKKVPADKQLLKGLHVSTSVVKLTNRAMNVIGCQNIVAGSYYSHREGTTFEIPYTILALAGAIIENELREIRKLPPTGGELGPPSRYLNADGERYLKNHQSALLLDQLCHTHEIAIVLDEIQKDFRLAKLAERMKFSKEGY